MLDANKYAQHFPDESRQSGAPEAKPASAKPVAATSTLLAALSQLEKEFRAILRKQANTADPSA
jgi:hypothetical protein